MSDLKKYLITCDEYGHTPAEIIASSYPGAIEAWLKKCVDYVASDGNQFSVSVKEEGDDQGTTLVVTCSITVKHRVRLPEIVIS